jgi:glycosyltransferase involved in cell wall biosynthesis
MNTENQVVKDKIIKLINQIPEVYQSIYIKDEFIAEGVRKNDWERLEVIKKYIKSGQTILDIGSNIGFFTVQLAKLFPENVFVSVESHPGYAQIQKELIAAEQLTNIILINAEITESWLEKAEASCVYFDVTILLSVLHHMKNAKEFLNKLSKISKSFLLELPHQNENRVCGKEVIKNQLKIDELSPIKPIFKKLDYEATTHCDPSLKRAFYYGDSPEYSRKSQYPYIGYPLSPRNYLLQYSEAREKLILHKEHLNKYIDITPGILLYDIAQVGKILYPDIETINNQIITEFDFLDTEDMVADIRPWNLLFTATGLKFIDYKYTPDLDRGLLYQKNRDSAIISDYIEKLYSELLKPVIIVDGVFFQLYQTGIARVWKSLLEEWVNNGFAKHIIVLDRAGTAPKIYGIRYLTVPVYNYHNVENDREMLQQICDEEGADLFISSYYTTPITTPSVFMAYDMIPEVMGWDMNNPMWQEKHHAIQHASTYIAISQNTADDLVNYFPDISKTSVTVAHCGVKKSFTPATITAINSWKNQYGITKPYFLIVGGGGGYKNSILFFQAFSQLASSYGFDIVFTGGGGILAPEFRAYTSGSSVHMLQLSDEELAIAYSGALALVYPSKYEGFGMPIVEAMACGCPVITCPNGSIPEVAGESVIYVNDHDVDGLSNALCEVQKPSIRNSLINAGLAQAKKFSWSKMAEAVSSVLVDTTLLSLNLNEINLIIFPDWSQPEELIGEELQEVIRMLATHPHSENIALLVNTGHLASEDVELFLSSVAMNLLVQEDLAAVAELAISLVSNLADIQWAALLPHIHARIILEYEDKNALVQTKAATLSSYKIENFIQDKQFFFT